jgi:hypothetical protein
VVSLSVFAGVNEILPIRINEESSLTVKRFEISDQNLYSEITLIVERGVIVPSFE